MDLAAVLGVGLILGSFAMPALLPSGWGAVMGAFLITVGVVLSAFSSRDLFNVLKLVLDSYFDSQGSQQLKPVADEMIRIATLARKDGLLAAESQKETIKNLLFRKGLQFAIDGMDGVSLRAILDTEVKAQQKNQERAQDLLNNWGRWLPGAGLALAFAWLAFGISHLSHGMTVLAWTWGVAFLVLRPWQSRLRQVTQSKVVLNEMVLQGVFALQEGVNPSILQEKLTVYLSSQNAA